MVMVIGFDCNGNKWQWSQGTSQIPHYEDNGCWHCSAYHQMAIPLSTKKVWLLVSEHGRVQLVEFESLSWSPTGLHEQTPWAPLGVYHVACSEWHVSHSSVMCLILKLNFGGHRYGDAVDWFSKPVANFELELLRALCALATAALNCSGRSKFSTGLQRRPYVRSNLSSCLLKKEQALKFLMWCEMNVLKDFQDVLVWCIMCACIFLGGANAPNIIPASPQVKRRGLVLAFWWRSKQHLSYFCDIYILKDFKDVLAWLEYWCVHILGWSKWPKYHPCIFTREKKRSFPIKNELPRLTTPLRNYPQDLTR